MVCVSGTNIERRSRKFWRSESSLKIPRRSIPRIITWCNTPGASNLANRGIIDKYHQSTRVLIYIFMDVPLPHGINKYGRYPLLGSTWAIGALIGRLAHPTSAKTARKHSIQRTAHMAFDVPSFIDASYLPGESSDIIDFIAPFLAYNKSKNWARNL